MNHYAYKAVVAVCITTFLIVWMVLYPSFWR